MRLVNAPPSRIVVTGASGNVGSGVLRALARRMPEAEIVGVCRRPPTVGEIYDGIRWHAIDLSSPTATAELAPAMESADVVVHIALAVQPVDDEAHLYRANVLGSRAVLDAMAAAGVPHLVYASSLGIYAPIATESATESATVPVTEDWPDTGQPTSAYSRHKVVVERMLDDFIERHPEITVARFRPTVVVQRQAAHLIRSLYLGPLVPRALFGLLRRRPLPAVPLPTGIALQFVHADDVGDLVTRLIERRSHGSFNVAADVLDADGIAGLVGGRAVAVDPRWVRAAVTVLHALRMVPLTPGWYDVATNTPLMDTSRARDELDWAPTRSSAESAWELINGLADGAVGSSPATGWTPTNGKTLPATGFRRISDRTHDVSLLLWTALAVARALGVGKTGAPTTAAVVTNLASGTPMAAQRVLARRRDPVALLAPVAVAVAVAATRHGGWAPVVATGVLNVLNVSERQRNRGVSHG
ncbi:NAD-dependent epimerase/dehydratase family protein [Mycobacterium sp. Root135]|uniref:NAD-dependent epimerase/dehydratase family protein n=1 Tax=Mycobacterium sp. Root135 TaxID=1736457 RepID=UPI000A999148|nr:NAD-dependent epimerase/dehydratase family protein [Mycobacterium sp. Root135]